MASSSPRLLVSAFALALALAAAAAAPACSPKPQTTPPDGAASDSGSTKPPPPSASGCDNDQACPAGQVCQRADGAAQGSCTKGCREGNTVRTAGESFPSSDGCNTCSCSEAGVQCTQKACPCEPDREKNREYRMKDPAQCKAALFRCPEGAKPFFNTCGCGCEQPASCPPTFNCMPGPGAAPCNAEEIKAKCPLSVIAQ